MIYDARKADFENNLILAVNQVKEGKCDKLKAVGGGQEITVTRDKVGIKIEIKEIK